MVMRKIQVVIISALLSGVSFSAFAQETDKNKEQQNLNREMTLEREYDPIVQDATKVNTLPVVREMSIMKRPIIYSDYAVALMPDKEMNTLPAGSLMTDVEHLKRNGYLHFGGGMLMNLTGDFGYHLLNTESDHLGIYFSHRSMNGNIEFDKEWNMEKHKAKFNDNMGGLDYKHRFDKATLKLGGKFGYSAFNYYGKHVASMPINWGGSPMTDTTTNQGNRLINVYGGVTSDISSYYGYRFDVGYTNFNQKYSFSSEYEGMTENHIDLGLGFSSPVNDGKFFGVDVKANILSYTAPAMPTNTPNSAIFSAFLLDSAFSTHFNGTLTPYFCMENDKLKLFLGVNLMFVSQNNEIDVLASPNITLDVPVSTWTVFYTKLGGGIESNSMAELSRTNRYINPTFPADASKTWADLQLGIRSSASAGLWFDFFAGYKYTDSDILFNPSPYFMQNSGFHNVIMAFQPTTQRIQVGAALKYDFQKVVDFYLKGEYNHYIVKELFDKNTSEYTGTWKSARAALVSKDDELKAYGRPEIVANAGINVRPIKPLTFNLDYCMMSGMYAHVDFENVKMKAINDLRLRASWQFNDMFSIYAQCNNLLFQKSEMYYGYPVQPFSAMAGFSLNF